MLLSIDPALVLGLNDLSRSQEQNALSYLGLAIIVAVWSVPDHFLSGSLTEAFSLSVIFFDLI